MTNDQKKRMSGRINEGERQNTTKLTRLLMLRSKYSLQKKLNQATLNASHSTKAERHLFLPRRTSY